MTLRISGDNNPIWDLLLVAYNDAKLKSKDLTEHLQTVDSLGLFWTILSLWVSKSTVLTPDWDY
jgi:hypothetical protein